MPIGRRMAKIPLILVIRLLAWSLIAADDQVTAQETTTSAVVSNTSSAPTTTTPAARTPASTGVAIFFTYKLPLDTADWNTSTAANKDKYIRSAQTSLALTAPAVQIRRHWPPAARPGPNHPRICRHPMLTLFCFRSGVAAAGRVDPAYVTAPTPRASSRRAVVPSLIRTQVPPPCDPA